MTFTNQINLPTPRPSERSEESIGARAFHGQRSIPRGVPLRMTKRGHRRAMSLPEVLISLAITALLLTAVATAFSASASAIEVNDRFFRATQAARVSLAQILALVRRCDSCEIVGYTAPATTWSSTSIKIRYLDEINGTGFIDSVYQYSGAPTNQLQLIQNGATNSLAHNVSAVTFTATYAPIGTTNPVMTPINVTVDITVSIDGQTVHVRGSAAPWQVYYTQF